MKPEVSPSSRAQASTQWVVAVDGAVLAAGMLAVSMGRQMVRPNEEPV